MATPNTVLRELRERTSSSRYPGEGLSRQELAEKVNSHLWTTHRQRVEVDAGYIGKLERGVIRWPGGSYREALRTILRVSTDAELGFGNTRRAAVPVAEPGPVPSGVPDTVDERHVRDVAGAAELLSAWDHRHGGWSLLEATLAQARWARELVRAGCPAPLRAPLHQAVADLVGACGFKLFDTGAHREASRYFRFALECAEEAGDWHRRARILARMVRLAVETGQADQALTLAEYGLVRADRLSPVRQAMLHAAHAKALAAMLRKQEALRAIGAADEAFDRASDDDFATLPTDRYTRANLAGETCEALATLRTDFGASFTLAQNGFGDEYPRSRVLAELKFASFTLATGDPAEAARIGHVALDTAERMRSGRVDELVRVLEREVAEENSRAVRDLHDRLRSSVCR
ncbi:multiprotein-bridging factor 1 family protein [Amycolatopsis sp. NPDC088138]|uniref:helix-turn-helix domain-containing protein n=1 Tax=Amycolatopsis sp. NPDC088138 TaxID=3363938 RepID=UPI0037F55651